MRYTITNELTNENFHCDFLNEVEDIIIEQLHYTKAERGDISVQKEHNCRGCQEYDNGKIGIQERHDAHGITTGHWCYDCYEGEKYPYRKDKYPTIETHGYGERLSEDY